MFYDNKYTKWYYAIIQNRINFPLTDDEYGEKHHILPRSLGGDNSESNLIKLTAREHFVCHLLLIKMVIDTESRMKMNRAAFGMAIMNKVRINSKIYESLKIQHSNSMKSNNPVFNAETRRKISNSLKALPPRISTYIPTDEHKKKLSESAKGRIPWNKGKAYVGGGMTGKTHSDETKSKISIARKGQELTSLHREKISEALIGIRRSDETRRKMSASKTGVVHPTRICEHCGKEIAVGMYARWHGDRCKNYLGRRI